MWRIGFLLMYVLALGAICEAQTVTLTLQEDLSSKLPTGTAFTAADTAGKVYNGHVVTHPARRMLRRGSMSLVFDDPVVPVTKDREGVFRAGNKMRLLKLGGSLAAAKLADDSVDGAIGATKARYVGAAVSAALIVFQKVAKLIFTRETQSRSNLGAKRCRAYQIAANHARRIRMNPEENQCIQSLWSFPCGKS